MKLLLYLAFGVFLALILFWMNSIFWPAEYRQLKFNFLWIYVAVAIGVFVFLYFQEARDSGDDDDRSE